MVLEVTRSFVFLGKVLHLLQIYYDFGVVLCIRLHNAGIAMSFWGKQQWDKMISTSSLSYGSVPNLLSTPCSASRSNLKMRASVDFLREWASDLGSLSAGLNLNLSSAKWPSLFTVCKWKQTLTEKLKKRPCSSTDESQVRKHIHLTISLFLSTIIWSCEILLEIPGNLYKIVIIIMQHLLLR